MGKKRGPRHPYHQHRFNAKKRGIAFLLTWEEWLQIWTESGHFHERGCRKGQYVMARFGDKGPYAVGNVKIVPVEQNSSEGNLGKIVPLKTRLAISNARLGMKFSAETCARIGRASSGHKRCVGRKYSKETIEKMRVSAIRRWQRERNGG